MKKTGLLIFFSIILLFMFTGCGGGSSVSGTGSETSDEGSLSFQVSYPQDQAGNNSPKETAIAYYLIEICNASSPEHPIQTVRMDYPQTQAVINDVPVGTMTVCVNGYDGKNAIACCGECSVDVTIGSSSPVSITMTPVESPTASPTSSATSSPITTPTVTPTATPTITPTSTPTESPTPSPSPTDKWTVLTSYPSRDEISVSSVNSCVCENGSIVVFDTNQPLITEHNNSYSQVYLYATATGTLRIISGNTAGAIGNANSKYPFISGNGKMAAFASDATNISGAGMDTNGKTDIFMVNLENNTTGMISVSNINPAIGGNGDSDRPALNYDGTKAVYHSYSTNLTPSGQVTDSTKTYVFLTTVEKSTAKPTSSNTQLVSNKYGLSVPKQPNERSSYARISGDGTKVVFSSVATDIADGNLPGDGTYEIFLCDLLKPIENRTLLISQKNGAPASTSAKMPDINFDGSAISFVCSDPALGGTNITDIYQWQNGILNVVTIPTGSGSSQSSDYATMDKTGRFVCFHTNGVYDPRDTNACNDVYVWDGQTKTYTLISVDSNGNIAETSSGSYQGFISGDGNYVTFISYAKNLAQGPPVSQGHLRNGVPDAYLRKWK